MCCWRRLLPAQVRLLAATGSQRCIISVLCSATYLAHIPGFLLVPHGCPATHCFLPAEGLMLKSLTAAYEPSRRSDHWLKLKRCALC